MEESFDNIEEQPSGERWDPLGAPNDEEEEPVEFDCDKMKFYDSQHSDDHLMLRSLEEEHERLNAALFALSSHFAKIQFRLKQLVDSPPEDREHLVKSLEEFAFRGIPDVMAERFSIDDSSLEAAMKMRAQQQEDLIKKLKSQLRDLEQYAFETGEAGIPQDVVFERQKYILSELKQRINLDVDEATFFEMRPECVVHEIDHALEKMISPLKVKEHLIGQLKTQIVDLERFIEYLQGGSGRKHNKKCSCGCAYHSVGKSINKDTTFGMIQKTATLLQMFAAMQLGCGTKFRENELKKTMKINHYGDLRAKLELAISQVIDLADCLEYQQQNHQNTEYQNNQLTGVVRKMFVPCLRDLIQHGCINQTSTLVPFIGCFPRRASVSTNQVHAWELILEYYQLKNGDKYNSTPARKLSQSFNLDIAGASANSNKHNMLGAIGTIISTHTTYKRSYDAHFKAFICAALNAHKLVPWLNLLFTCNKLIKDHYLTWSYVAKTGFQDSLMSLDVLTKYNFNLPVDLSVKQFQGINDVFT